MEVLLILIRSASLTPGRRVSGLIATLLFTCGLSRTAIALKLRKNQAAAGFSLALLVFAQFKHTSGTILRQGAQKLVFRKFSLNFLSFRKFSFEFSEFSKHWRFLNFLSFLAF